MERVKQVDDYMEMRFGKPDFSKTFWDKETKSWWTPLGNGNVLIFRQDFDRPLPDKE